MRLSKNLLFYLCILIGTQGKTLEPKLTTETISETSCKSLQSAFVATLSECENKSIYTGLLNKVQNANTCEKISSVFFEAWKKLLSETPFKEDKTCPAKHGNYDSPSDSLIYPLEYQMARELIGFITLSSANRQSFLKLPISKHETQFLFDLAQKWNGSVEEKKEALHRSG